MKPTDPVVRILLEIRDEIRAQGARTDHRIEQMAQRFAQEHERREQLDTRFTALPTLRELVDQVVMATHEVEALLKARAPPALTGEGP